MFCHRTDRLTECAVSFLRHTVCPIALEFLPTTEMIEPLLVTMLLQPTVDEGPGQGRLWNDTKAPLRHYTEHLEDLHRTSIGRYLMRVSFIDLCSWFAVSLGQSYM